MLQLLTHVEFYAWLRTASREALEFQASVHPTKREGRSAAAELKRRFNKNPVHSLLKSA